jgi:hypothetical protein
MRIAGRTRSSISYRAGLARRWDRGVEQTEAILRANGGSGMLRGRLSPLELSNGAPSNRAALVPLGPSLMLGEGSMQVVGRLQASDTDSVVLAALTKR